MKSREQSSFHFWVTVKVTVSPSQLSMEIGFSVYSVLPSESVSLAPITQRAVGAELGKALGSKLGEELGIELGASLGEALGCRLGVELGDALGLALGVSLG